MITANTNPPPNPGPPGTEKRRPRRPFPAPTSPTPIPPATQQRRPRQAQPAAIGSFRPTPVPAATPKRRPRHFAALTSPTPVPAATPNRRPRPFAALTAPTPVPAATQNRRPRPFAVLTSPTPVPAANQQRRRRQAQPAAVKTPRPTPVPAATQNRRPRPFAMPALFTPASTGNQQRRPRQTQPAAVKTHRPNPVPAATPNPRPFAMPALFTPGRPAGNQHRRPHQTQPAAIKTPRPTPVPAATQNRRPRPSAMPALFTPGPARNQQRRHRPFAALTPPTPGPAATPNRRRPFAMPALFTPGRPAATQQRRPRQAQPAAIKTPRPNPGSPGPQQRRPRRAIVAITLLTLALIALTGCTSEPSSLGQYYKGRTLHLSVTSLERTPELRYSTIDPTGVIRRWSLASTRPGHELILARLKVENHTAVSAIVNVDRAAAELRDFTNATYHPLTVDQQVWRDYRNQPQALIRVDLGQCFDGNRALINPGTTVQWQSESNNPQQLTFTNLSLPIAPNGRAQLPPQQSLTHTFTQPGNYPYTCGAPNGPQQNAEIQVTPHNNESPGYLERTAQFIQGSFQLPQGNGIDGYIIFEAPTGTQFRDLRWRAGDSITIRF